MTIEEANRQAARLALRGAIKTTLDAAHIAWRLAGGGMGLSQWESKNISDAIDAAMVTLKLAQAIEEKGQAVAE